MPTIPQLTASGQSGGTRGPTISPESYGSEGFKGVSTFGQSLLAVDAKQQEQQDRLDLAKLATDYDVQLAMVSQDVLATEPDVKQHLPQFTERIRQVQADLLKGNHSQSVKMAFEAHAEQAMGRAEIELAAQSRKLNGQRQIGNYLQQADDLMIAAAEAGPGERETILLGYEEDLRNGLVKSGSITPEQGVRMGAAAQDRRWSIVAQRQPERIIGILNSGQLPYGMDPAKRHTYVELAFQSMAAQQMQHDREQKAQDLQVKAYQEQNARLLTAELIEGGSVVGKLPTLLRARALTDEDGRTLHALEQTLKSRPDLSNYQPSLAPQIEATLGALKFSTEGLADHIEQNLVSEFIQGHILKDEFTHLMGVWRGVQDHRMAQGNETQNREVGHAHGNLLRALQTVGPADKYDALSGQTIEEAEQYFYRRMGQDPKQDPWKVKEEAEKIFKPVIESRLNLSATDKAKLQDATMLGIHKSGGLSKAAYDAWHKKEQNRRGLEAVQKAIDALPPPKDERSYWERINPFSKKPAEAPRKKPNVMQGE